MSLATASGDKTTRHIQLGESMSITLTTEGLVWILFMICLPIAVVTSCISAGRNAYKKGVQRLAYQLLKDGGLTAIGKEKLGFAQ